MATAYMREVPGGEDTSVSKEAFEASAITCEEWAEFLGVLSERMKINRHAKTKPLYEPKEHVCVYLSVLGGFVNKRYVAKKG